MEIFGRSYIFYYSVVIRAYPASKNLLRVDFLDVQKILKVVVLFVRGLEHKANKRGISAKLPGDQITRLVIDLDVEAGCVLFDK